jgi:predicted nucleic acid-binding protein
VTRYAGAPLAGRVWELRGNVTAYDATYVALAEVLACPLVTADARLARAPGLRCVVTVVPR